MEVLLKDVLEIPIQAVGLQGAIFIVLVAVALIIRLKLPVPKK
jgi:hypothetical protein